MIHFIYIIVALLLPSIAWAQTGTGANSVNPRPGAVWQYLGPTLGADWSAIPLTGNIVGGPSPTTINNLAIWDNTTGSLLRQNLQTVFPTANTTWGQTGGLSSVSDGKNGLVGATINNMAPSSTAFPTGTTGYGLLYPGATGNAVFGGYMEADLVDHGTAVGAEIDCFNYKGAPSSSLPSNKAIGTADNNCEGLQIGAGGNFQGSVGLQIGGALGGVYAAGTSQLWKTAIYIGGGITPGSGGASDYGLFIDAGATGPTTSAVLQNYGTGLNLQLGTTGNMVAANSVINVVDKNAVSKFAVKQNGDTVLNTINFNGHTAAPGLTSCGTSPTLGAGSTDARGIVSVGATTSACTVTFGTTYTANPNCVATGWNILLSITALSTTSFSVGAAGLGGSNFSYVCMQ